MTHSEVELRLTAPAHGGTCIAHDESGKPVFVSHTAPGERVRARIHSQRSKVAFAQAVEVLEANPYRRPHFWQQAGPGGVGGADLGHLLESYQRHWKGQVVADQMRRVGGSKVAAQLQPFMLDLPPLGPGADVPEGGHCLTEGPSRVLAPVVAVLPVRAASGDETGLALYRRQRIECVVSQRGRLAMRPEHGLELIDLEDMPLADERILALPVWGDSHWSRRWRPGARVRLLAPSDSDGVVVIDKDVYDSTGNSADPAVTWRVEHGDGSWDFKVSARGFWQSHRSAAADLVETVMRFAQVRSGERVAELYAGAGLFSLFLARAVGQAGRVLTLEGAGAAVADARANVAPFAGRTRCLRAPVNAHTVGRIPKQLGDDPTVVVLDPPRAGAGRAVIKAVGDLQPERVVLVSCDPAAGARDIAGLIEAGYQVSQFEAIDLFPQTHHVETVCLMTRAK